MQRRNRGPAGLPDVLIDLTPLLDVIFIFLFIVVIAYAEARQENDILAGQMAAEAQEKMDEATARMEDARTEIASAGAARAKAEASLAEAEQKIADLESRMLDQTALQSAYEAQLSALEDDVIGGKVRIVTIYCTFDPSDSKKRRIRLVAPDLENEAIEMNGEHERLGYERLRNVLTKYIRDYDESVIVLSLNTERILVTDRDGIGAVVAKLQEEFSYVY